MRVGLEFDVPRPLPDLDPIGLKRPDNILYSVSESDQGLVSRRMRGRVVKQLVFRPLIRNYRHIRRIKREDIVETDQFTQRSRVRQIGLQ